MMGLETQFIAALELILAAILSGVIGADRERGAHPAGLRTYMLVGVGACLFTSLSRHAFPGDDTSRIASNIVVGIGFLGAGVIIERERGIKNLTTAAGVWATAAVGMAVGTGAWFLAIVATLVIWFIMAIVIKFSASQSKLTSNREAPESER